MNTDRRSLGVDIETFLSGLAAFLVNQPFGLVSRKKRMAASPATLVVSQRKRFIDAWTCCVCTEMPLEPFQTPCAHRTCLACASKLKPKAGKQAPTLECPLCRNEFSNELVKHTAGDAGAYFDFAP